MTSCSLTVALSLILFANNLVTAAGRDGVQNMDGNGKLFWVSTTSTTSTLQTTTQCVKTSGTAQACGKKRKRSIVTELPSEDTGDILPSIRGKEDEFVDEVEDLLDEQSIIAGDRMPRFLLYWKTTTATSTSTSYTATSTLATAQCTPSGFALSPC